MDDNCQMDEVHVRELLARERRRVERALADLAGREDEDELAGARIDQHPADYATELFDEELEEGLAESLRAELEAIERAEQRLRDGTYGLSVESGRPIPCERLEVIPWAERTVEEQARYEQVSG
jgi:DnaK suppressor protein